MILKLEDGVKIGGRSLNWRMKLKLEVEVKIFFVFQPSYVSFKTKKALVYLKIGYFLYNDIKKLK